MILFLWYTLTRFLSEVHPEAAKQVFLKDCLVHIGTCIAPVGNAKSTGELLAQIQIEYADGKEENLTYYTETFWYYH